MAARPIVQGDLDVWEHGSYRTAQRSQMRATHDTSITIGRHPHLSAGDGSVNECSSGTRRAGSATEAASRESAIRLDSASHHDLFAKATRLVLPIAPLASHGGVDPGLSKTRNCSRDSFIPNTGENRRGVSCGRSLRRLIEGTRLGSVCRHVRDSIRCSPTTPEQRAVADCRARRPVQSPGRRAPTHDAPDTRSGGRAPEAFVQGAFRFRTR